MKRNRRDQDGFSRRDFIKTTTAGAGAAALTGLGAEEARAQGRPGHWDKEADVVVIGAGATGLPAAIQAIEGGASVILIDANTDVGGHAILSGGNVALGGGTSRQQKYGVVDSPDLLYSDLTDWSVVEPNGFPDYRYNDKEVIRAFADESAKTYEWLVAHGVTFVDKAPDTLGGHATGNSAPRENHAAPLAWPLVQAGGPVSPERAASPPRVWASSGRSKLLRENWVFRSSCSTGWPASSGKIKTREGFWELLRRIKARL